MITPFIWLPSVSGSIKLNLPSGSGSGNVDVGSDDYLDNLTFAGMLDLQVQKGRWSILSNIVYLDFSDDDRTAHFSGISSQLGGWTVDTDTELRALVCQVAGAYTLFRSKEPRASARGINVR